MNKKLDAEVQKSRHQDQGVVVLKKKDFEVLLNNYYQMSEELEQMSMLYSESCTCANVKKELADQYLLDYLSTEEEFRQFKIK